MHITGKGMVLLPLTSFEARVARARQWNALVLTDMRLPGCAELQRCQQV
jgi:hypothetical protein